MIWLGAAQQIAGCTPLCARLGAHSPGFAPSQPGRCCLAIVMRSSWKRPVGCTWIAAASYHGGGASGTFRGPGRVLFLQWGCSLERAAAMDWRLEAGGSSGSDGGGFDVQPQRVGPSLRFFILI